MQFKLRIGLTALSSLVVVELASAYCPPPLDSASTVRDVSINENGTLDPLDFFNQLVDRYQHLAEYEDSAQIVEITDRAGEASHRRETNIITELDDSGQLNVRTAGAELRRSFGFCLPGPVTDPLDSLSLRYALWMAPHMSLRYMDDDTPPQPNEPEQQVTKRLKPVEASPVMIDERPLVHLELQLEGASLTDDSDESLNVYVNPDSMLIERVESRQRLSDGASVQTTVHIMPTHARSDEEVAVPSVPQPQGGAPVGLRSDEPSVPHSPQSDDESPMTVPASTSGSASVGR